MRKKLIVPCMVLCIFSLGCKTEHKVEVEVKPMQITIDVNVRIDRQLEDFFGNLDEAAKSIGGGTAGAEKTEESNKSAQ
ncbi:MAG: hypothetical protein HRU72_02980 [Planctomycetia bacterium]|mgnify:CR=1 FL=1|uniref:Uncharacterized protein n=2 Tax=Candidatus Brocadia sapporoensis TaxID=392547 RepID=A0A1V6LZ68_9BACT|nr:hypothetical protein [Candidatus Brocadia sp.]OQD45430.1 hypothetical protein BIY37_08485 [Candidatus Brocadia sapporoensis]QOJ05579.1 MAG: hypothetical protein HRU72_02980 [Planctomycetia bacterium]TVL98501.1 MAG: hypothetical protein CV082_00055 [Candidatus Brocadia sp. BL1]MDG6006257.1 hypothetical protein [Candidatus Brocadia sp.]